jgi:hypothetical protein
LKAALLFALLATSPNPGAGPQTFERGVPIISRGRSDGGVEVLRRGPHRIAADDKTTTFDFLNALRAHVEPLRNGASTCWVRVGQWVVNHPRVELNIAGKKFPGTITCSSDQLDKWTSQRAQYVKMAVTGPDNKVIAVFHKYGGPSEAFQKEAATVSGGSGGPATTLTGSHLKSEGQEVTVIALPFGS